MGHNKFDEYKSGKEIYKTYLAVKKMGGSFLLNIGPTSNFEICEAELSAIKEFSNLFDEYTQ